MAVKRPLVLFYTADTAPSEAEIEQAQDYEWGNVAYRTAAFFEEDLEPCDAVAGVASVTAFYAKNGVKHADDYKPARSTRSTRATADAEKAKGEAKAKTDAAKAEVKAEAAAPASDPLWATAKKNS